MLTPAFVDPHSHIGLHRAAQPRAESEANEALDAILPLADALDSVNMDDPAFTTAVEFGTLYSCVMPGSLNVVSGSSAVIRHFAHDTNAALVGRAGVKAALGFNLTTGRDAKGSRASTRMGYLALLRAKLHEVREKGRRRGGRASSLSAADRILWDIVRGRTRLRVHAHKADDLAALLRLVEEFGLRVTVEHAMDVFDIRVFHQLRDRNIPVVYGPVETVPSKVELLHKDWRNAHLLVESGVEFGLMSDHPVVPTWTLLQQTRPFLRAGMTKAQCIELLTRRNARLLGLNQAGVLAPGKWASFLCWNGDPFDLASYPTAVYGEGQRLFPAP